MSESEDLRSREDNNIVAADVVDGNLILKRYDGTKEIVALGGGASLLDSDVLKLTLSTIVPSGGEHNLLITAGDLINHETGVSASLFDETALHAAVEGEDVGTSFNILYQPPGFGPTHTLVYFKEPGLYWMSSIVGIDQSPDTAYLRAFTSPGARNFEKICMIDLSAVAISPAIVGIINVNAFDVSSNVHLELSFSQNSGSDAAAEGFLSLSKLL